MAEKVFLIESMSIFRHRYAISANDLSEALLKFNRNMDSLEEFSQQHMGEKLFSNREISKKDFIELFDEDNDYLRSLTDEQKLAYINNVTCNI
jgi:hypothetical protein